MFILYGGPNGPSNECLCFVCRPSQNYMPRSSNSHPSDYPEASNDIEGWLRYPRYDMSVTLERETRASREASPRGDDLINKRVLAAELEELARKHAGTDELRRALAQQIKAALASG